MLTAEFGEHGIIFGFSSKQESRNGHRNNATFEKVGDVYKEIEDGKLPGVDLPQWGVNKISFAFGQKCGKV